jgi:hypothetical protein
MPAKRTNATATTSTTIFSAGGIPVSMPKAKTTHTPKAQPTTQPTIAAKYRRRSLPSKPDGLLAPLAFCGALLWIVTGHPRAVVIYSRLLRKEVVPRLIGHSDERPSGRVPVHWSKGFMRGQPRDATGTIEVARQERSANARMAVGRASCVFFWSCRAQRSCHRGLQTKGRLSRTEKRPFRVFAIRR